MTEKPVCRAPIGKPPATMAEFFGKLFGPEAKRCGAEACYLEVGGGAYCTVHAHALARTTFEQKNGLGMLLAKRGNFPKTYEEAFAKWFRPIGAPS